MRLVIETPSRSLLRHCNEYRKIHQLTVPVIQVSVLILFIFGRLPSHESLKNVKDLFQVIELWLFAHIQLLILELCVLIRLQSYFELSHTNISWRTGLYHWYTWEYFQLASNSYICGSCIWHSFIGLRCIFSFGRFANLLQKSLLHLAFFCDKRAPNLTLAT